MPCMPRTAILAIFAAASCSAFQAPLPNLGASLALRGLRPVTPLQYRPEQFQTGTTIDSKPKDELKQIFVTRTSKLPLSTVSTLPINYDERLSYLPQGFQIIPEQNFQVFADQAVLKPAAPRSARISQLLAVTAVLAAALSLIEKIPGSHNVLAHFAGGAMGGVAALCVSRPGDAMVTGSFPAKVATHGVVKGVSAACYTAMYLTLAGASLVGLAAVAVASMGTGLIIGMVCKALERASAIGEDLPLLTRLQTKASLGLFTQDGLFGSSSLTMARDLATCVVQYQAFYLAWVALCMAYPWMAVTFTGSAVSGAISGIASLAAGSMFLWLTNLSEFSRMCKELWCGPVRKRQHAANVLDTCSMTAIKSAALFLAYKGVYDLVMAILV